MIIFSPNLRKSKVREIKKSILLSSYKANACHIGSALSCVKILVDLFYGTLQKGDLFLFGKASGVATYYSILADKGYFPKHELHKYLKEYPLPSTEVPGVLHSFGSVGHALSVSAGLALSNRKKRVFVLLSDGDLQEGATYEAALFARQHKLKNLYVIVDNNKIVACGKTKDVLDLKTAFKFYKKTLPNIKIVNTIKGEGVSFMENSVDWHYRNLTESQLSKALWEI